MTDPYGGGIVKQLDAPEGNITGVSNYSPEVTKIQLEFFRKLLPNLQTLGFINNSGEVNSTILLEKIKVIAKELGIKIKEATAQNTNEAVFITRSILNGVDAIFIDNDNTALGAIKGIVDVSMKSKKPVFCSDIDTVNLGVLASVGPNQYKLGEQAAEMVLKILQNKEKIRNLPVKFASNNVYLVNKKSAETLGIKVPTDEFIEVVE